MEKDTASASASGSGSGSGSSKAKMSMSGSGGNLSALQDIALATANALPRTSDDANKAAPSLMALESENALASHSVASAVPNLPPPPTAAVCFPAGVENSEMESMPQTPASSVSQDVAEESPAGNAIGPAVNTSEVSASLISGSTLESVPAMVMRPITCDFDSDTELSIVAAATASAASGNGGAGSAIVARSPPSPSLASRLSQLNPGAAAPIISSGGTGYHQVGFASGAATVNANGHNNSSTPSSNSSTHLSLNAKQQRQQKRRRERAQRLQAERDGRCNASALNATFVAGSVGVGSSSGGGGGGGGSGSASLTQSSTQSSGQGSLLVPSGAATSLVMGNGPGNGSGNANGMIYHINSAGSMGEDSNNSNGNFTSSSNGSNNLLPPTDSIASLLLNPPHSPECNSGLMASPSDSEGESLDEDLLSTSSSSTLLLPRDKPPPRPPPPIRRKLPRSPVLEEEIIDGFAILEFKTYEDLEFAIKLGQKRKEKRLSALEELTCTYSIEEMKIPKIIDTGQPHPLRVTLSVVSHNLKDNSQHLNRNNAVVSVGNVVGKSSVNTNGPTSNSNSGSGTNVVYMLPTANIGTDTETHAEPVAYWQTEYGEQQDKLQYSRNKININNENQINNNNQQVNYSNQTIKQTQDNVSGNDKTSFEENGKDSIITDANRSMPGSSVTPHNHIDVGVVGTSCSGGETNKSRISQAVVQTNEQMNNGSKSSSIGLISSSVPSDVSGSGIYINNNHQRLSKQPSHISQTIKKSNMLETTKSNITDEACTLEIPEIANCSTPVVAAINNVKKETDNFNEASKYFNSNNKGTNICDNISDESKNTEKLVGIDYPSATIHASNVSSHGVTTPRKSSEFESVKKLGSACGDNISFPGVPFSPIFNAQNATTTETDSSAFKQENSPVNSQGKIVLSNATALMSSTITTDSEIKEQGTLKVSTCDKTLYPVLCITSTASSVQTTSVGVSLGSEKNTPSISADDDHIIIFNTKTTVSNGLSAGANRSTVSNSQTPAVSTGPFTPRSSISNSGLPTMPTAASTLLPNNIKSNDNLPRSIDTNVTTNGIPNTSETQKPSNISSAIISNPMVNGFLSGYTTSPATSVITSALSRVSPNASSKLVSPTISTSTVGVSPGTTNAAGIGKIAFGAGGNATGSVGSPLLFAGAPPNVPNLATGLPIIQASQYRAPYTNYPLYTPYNSLNHGTYLPPIVPVASSNLLSSQVRSSDGRSSRESPASKVTVASNIGVQQSSSIASSIQSTAPLNNSGAIGINATPATTTGIMHSVNSTAHSISYSHIPNSNHAPPYAASTFGAATAAPSNITSGLSTTSVTSLPSPAPQPLPPPTAQIFSQTGHFPSMSHMLTAHPQMNASITTQQQPLGRGGSTLYSSTVAATNISASILTFQNSTIATTTCPSSVSLSSLSPSSVIQKVISPKSDNSCNKDRDFNYSNANPKPLHNVSTSQPVVSQGINLGSQFCGIAPAQYGAVPTLPSNSSMGTGSLSTYSSKTGLWLNAPASTTIISSCGLSTPLVSSGSARPASSLLNVAAPNVPKTGNPTINQTFPSSPYLSVPSASQPSPSTDSIATASNSSVSLGPRSLSTFSTTTIASTTTTISSTQPTTAILSSPASNTPHPFSAESLFQPSKNDQADLLRRELDSRFLDRSGLAVAPTPPSTTYLRPELQHHHHHTHLHQNQQLLSSASATSLPTAQAAPGQIFPPPLFKDIPKLTTVDPQFYRSSIGLTPGGYQGYSSSGLLHNGLGGPTPFVPPNHMTSFAPKKTGRWNAMHVRIAWEIYYHQNKQCPDKTGCSVTTGLSHNPNVNPAAINATIATGSGSGPVSINNAPSALGGGNPVAGGPPPSIGIKTTPTLGLNGTPQHLIHRSNELSSAAFPTPLPGRSPFETSPLAPSFLGAPPSHIGTNVSPFGRYVTPFGFTGLTHFGGHIDAWRTNAMQRSVAYHPSTSSASSNWAVKTDNVVDVARREAEERERELREREQRERDRQRREREERERKEKEEKLKREQLERERERERDRKERERERREIERRELERERILQQQRINESNKQTTTVQSAVPSTAPARDRSPHRNVGDLNTDIRIKEEHPRTKDEQEAMLMRASATVAVGDPRYHPSSFAAAQANAAAAAAHHHHTNFIAASRHGIPTPSHLTRTMMPPTLAVGGPITHFAASAPPGWVIDPYRDPYQILRYNPIMEAALRHEAEERQKALNIYAAQSAAHLRVKEPSPIPPPTALGPPPPHHRLQTGVGSTNVQQTPQSQTQPPLSQLSAGIVVGKNSGPASIGIPVQHMIAVDSLGHQTIGTKKESDHSMGIVVSTAAVGLNSVSGGVLGISPVPSVAPTR